MKKRIWLLLSILVVAAMLTAACTSPSSSGGTQSTGGASSAATTAPTTAPVVEATTAMTSTTGGEPGAASGANATTPVTGTTTMTGTGTTTSTTTMTGTGTTTGTTTAATGEIDCMGAKSGDTVSMLYQWSGQEETNLNNILKPLADKCGIVFKPESTRDQALLDTRVKANTPPDIAFWQLVTVQQYSNLLKPLDTLGATADNYPQSLREQGSANGKWYGLPVKTDIKTIIWYSPTNFEALGYSVPKTWDELNTLVEKMVADGNVPWSMGFESGDATGWTGSDFIEDIVLVQKGPQYVMDVISGKTPYNDAGMKAAWETYGKWAKDPKYTVGGAKGTLSTSFNDAIYNVFSDPPQAMMVRQSGFAGGSITSKFPNLKYGTDFDFFQVPDAQGMQAGSDWMMAFSDKPAVKALVAYLTSETGAAQWAKVGFDLTPNSKGAGNYSDPLMQKKAELLNAAKAVVPSIGDSIPGGFGKAQWTGIINYVNGAAIDASLSTVAAAQADALKK